MLPLGLPHFNQIFNWFTVNFQISEFLNEAPGLSSGVNLTSSIFTYSILKLFRERFSLYLPPGYATTEGPLGLVSMRLPVFS